MTEQNSTAATEAKNAIEQYKETEEKQELSRDALEAIGCTRQNQVTNWSRDNLPVTRHLFQTDSTWIMTEKHSKQKGPKRQIWYLAGIGTMSVTHEDLDMEAAREVIENDENWDADTNQALDAIEQHHRSIDAWWADGIHRNVLSVTGDENLLCLSQVMQTPDYVEAPELDSGEKDTFLDAVNAAHALLYDYRLYYSNNSTVHYAVTPEFDPSNLDIDALLN
jgi:ribosomal 50S subunit-associated protein YjgA (DUF615 family)